MMNEQGVRRFLLSLGVRAGQMHSSRGWVNAPCVMAQWMHGSGVDEHPSFGISVSEGRSVFFCFGCHPKASQLEGLLHDIFIMSGEYPWEAAQVFVEEENHEEEVQVGVPDVWAEERVEVNPLPKSVLGLFPFLQVSYGDGAIACRKYLAGRGIPEWVQNLYQVRYDPWRGCLVFSLTDVNGRVFMFRERSITEKKMWTVSPKLLGWDETIVFPKLRDSGAWFGVSLINWRRPVILVEGECDAMRLAALGEFNAIASATSSVSEAQMDAVSASTIFLGYDSDKAGALAHYRITERLKDRAVLYELDWSAVGRKDPGELKNKKELEEVMQAARPV